MSHVTLIAMSTLCTVMMTIIMTDEKMYVHIYGKPTLIYRTVMLYGSYGIRNFVVQGVMSESRAVRSEGVNDQRKRDFWCKVKW